MGFQPDITINKYIIFACQWQPQRKKMSYTLWIVRYQWIFLYISLRVAIFYLLIANLIYHSSLIVLALYWWIMHIKTIRTIGLQMNYHKYLFLRYIQDSFDRMPQCYGPVLLGPKLQIIQILLDLKDRRNDLAYRHNSPERVVLWVLSRRRLISRLVAVSLCQNVGLPHKISICGKMREKKTNKS